MRNIPDFKQMSFEDDSVNRIRSHYQTLSRYLRTSIALHGYPKQSVFVLAVTLNEQVSAIVDANPGSAAVKRWGEKFQEFVNQHDLLAPRVGD